MCSHRMRSTDHPIEHLACLSGANMMRSLGSSDSEDTRASALAESRLLRFALLVALGCIAWSMVAEADDGRVEIDQAAAIAGGVTWADAPGFPVMISEPGRYVLTSDLVIPSAVTEAIVFGPHAADASIDLNGFEIRRRQRVTKDE